MKDHLTCPHCGKNIDLFKTNGGKQIAASQNLNLLASLPIEEMVVKHADVGSLALLLNNNLPFTEEFGKLADQIEKIAK